jgi:mono/diheme cytochrome c family protein
MYELDLAEFKLLTARGWFMFINVIWLIAFVLLAVVSIRYFVRFVRSSRMLVRFGGGFSVGLLSLLLGLISVLGLLGIIYTFTYSGSEVVEVQIEGTAEQIERGSEIASWTCSGCHSLDNSLPLTGGKDIMADVPIPIGKATPANLTPAGRIADWSDGELQRAIREGTAADGSMLSIMSANTFRYLSQQDLDAVVAYLRSEEPVETDIEEENSLTFLSMVLQPLGMLPIKSPPDFGPPPHVEPAESAVYGEYITKVFDCALCHGDDFSGGPGGIVPAGPSLAGAKVWTSEQFINAMRTGATPYGTTLDEKMPWEEIGKMDDQTLTAVLLYLKDAAP